MLYHRKLTLNNVQEWGSQVWVYTLDGRLKIGRWIGFKDISNGHQIYWLDKRSVTIEQSIKFINDEVIFSSNPIARLIQGEKQVMNQQRNPETKSKHKEQDNIESHEDDPDDSNINQPTNENQAQDQQQKTPQNIDKPATTRSHQIGFQTCYIKDIQSGVGTADN